MSVQSLPKVSVVVPIYNRIHHTRAFLQEFVKVTYPNYEIVIVDDGSTDGSSEIIRKEFPSVKILREEKGNLWWSNAMNIGVHDALARGADYILSINDDVTFNPEFLTHLLAYAQEHPRTLVGCMIYDYAKPEKLWYAGGKMAWLRGDLLHRRSLDDGTLSWLTGMGTLIPSAAYREVGLYDGKHFPQYTGDSDFSLRARKKGFSLAIEPSSIIWNKTEESTENVLRRTATWTTFYSPLFTIKSASHMPTRWYMLRYHWPVVLAPIAFVVYYLRFTGKQLLRVLKLR